MDANLVKMKVSMDVQSNNEMNSRIPDIIMVDLVVTIIHITLVLKVVIRRMTNKEVDQLSRSIIHISNSSSSHNRILDIISKELNQELKISTNSI